jgi:hypothetical protein
MAVKSPHNVVLGTLTIANAGTTSNTLDVDAFHDCTCLTIYAPVALTGTVKPQFADSDITASPNWRNIRITDNDMVVAAGGATIVANYAGTRFPAFGLRLVSSGAEGAQRDFVVVGTRPVHTH